MDEPLKLELDLVSDGQGGYGVTVRSAAGEESGRLAVDPWAVLRMRRDLQMTLLASAVTPRSAVSEVEAPVREVGERLFRALFDEGVYAAYKASLAVAVERGTQLRVVLRTQPPELAALPWEMLYDPDVESYLCRREPLIRHVSVPSATRAIRVTPPLRILGVVSAPRDRPRLDVAGERKRLEKALAPLGSRVALHWARGGRWADVQEELIAGSWHVLHFVGHGGFDDAGGEGVLVLENHEGDSDLVGAERFSDLLTLQVPPLQLVVLNSCAGGQAAADDLFSSSAATLIRTGVSAVVAMQFAVSDWAAKAFAAGFYQAIAHNHSIAEAVRIGRIGIRGTSEHTLEWITPVLYLRGEDAALFEVTPSPAEEQEDVPDLSPTEAAEQAGAAALYQQAMSLYRGQRYAESLPLFDSLLQLRPDYRDAAARRERAAREARVAEPDDQAQAAAAYDQVAEAEARAQAAEQRGDWAAAVRGYAAVRELDPGRPGVRDALERARRGEEVANLQAELRAHVVAEDWPAAVAVADELRRLAPEESDPAGLATTARLRAVETDPAPPEPPEPAPVPPEPPPPPEPQPAEPVPLPDPEPGPVPPVPGPGPGPGPDPEPGLPRFVKYLIAAAVLVVVAGGAVWAWPDPGGGGGGGGDVDPPAPFRSAALYEMARHHYDPASCWVPERREEAPLAWSLPLTELVRCNRVGEGDYTGTLMCTDNRADFDAVREAYLDKAVGGTQPVTEPPAGRSDPWPFQVVFHHEDGGRGRVFWDDPDRLCSVEMQLSATDLDVARDHFATGLG